MRPDEGDGPELPQEEIAARIRASAVEAREGAERAVLEIEATLGDFNTFDLLAWVALANLNIDPDNYTEAGHGGSAAKAEYLTLQALRIGFKPGTKRVMDGEEYEALDQALDRVFTSGWITEMEQAINRGANARTESELPFIERQHEKFVRAMGYPVHLKEVLRRTFAPVQDELEGALGFGIELALALEDAIGEITSDRVRERARAVRKSSIEFLAAIRKAKADGIPSENQPRELREWLTLDPEGLEKAVHVAAVFQVSRDAGQTFSITPAELASRAGVREEKAAQFCDCFSCEFGTVGPEFAFPQVLHPLKLRPLVHRDGRYLAHLIGSLLWAIKPRFEEALKGTGRPWERYSVGRHNVVVKMAQECFAKILDPVVSLTHAYYPVASDEEAEVDLVARFDSSLFFVEAKAGSLRDLAKKGVPPPLLDQLKELVTEPHQQAQRALEYVQNNLSPVFQTRKGRELEIPRGSIRHCFLVTILLEPLGHLFTHMTADSPELGSGSTLPWVVSLLDLMVIADCLHTYGAWFPVYLQRRQRVLELKVIRTSDELDLFMHFLTMGLYFEDDEDLRAVDLYMVGTLTDPLDWYYFRQAGLRTRPAPRPKPSFEAAVLRFVEALRKSGTEGWSDAAAALIHLNEGSRKRFTDQVTRVKKKSKKDRKEHSVTLHDDPGGHGGLTYYCSPDGVDEGDLKSYASRKRRELRVPRWVVVGDRGRRSTDISCVVVDPPSCFDSL